MLDKPAMSSAIGVLGEYRALIEAGRLEADPAQTRAAERLDALWRRLRGYDPYPSKVVSHNGWLGRLLNRKRVDEAPDDYPSGLYLVGEVGHGKSMLMDLFFEQAEVKRKRRIHFHQFMQEVHARLHRVHRADMDVDPMEVIAASIAAEAALLCFDEFQVLDIGDGQILARLFEGLFSRAVVVVATSNTPPDDLLRGGTGCDLLRPFIDLLKRHLDVLVLEAARDYRRDRLRGIATWYAPANDDARKALDAIFANLAGGAIPRTEILRVFGRNLEVPIAANGVARFDFATLCARALGSGDFLAIATHFPTVLIDGIPKLLPSNFDQVRRFITLVDALYEHRVKLYASAAAPPSALYLAGEGTKLFERTLSRLEEMQSEAYATLAHLP